MNSCFSLSTANCQPPPPPLTTNFFTITIPVKTYVRKYIETRYRQPIKITLNHYLGAVVYTCITHTKQTIKTNNNYKEVRYRLLTDIIKIYIPRLQVTRHNIGLAIPFEKAVLINNLFEEKIAEDLHTYCKSYSKSGKPQRQAIEDFCTDHNIELEIDITYTAFRKAEYRHKKKLTVAS